MLRSVIDPVIPILILELTVEVFGRAFGVSPLNATGQPKVQVPAAGAVNKLVLVRVQPPLAVKLAVTLTGLPSAAKPVRLTVCGLPVIGKF